VRHRYTLRDYLDIEELGVVRHEFIDGEIVAMAGGTPEHAALAGAVGAALGAQLGEGPCRVYSADLRIRVLATGLATYADASVICGPVERDPESPTHVTNPVVIVEVLSASTEDYDRGEKWEHYRRIAALRHYVLVAQDVARIEVWSRKEGDDWQHSTLARGDILALPAVDVTLDVDRIYTAAGLGNL